MDNNNSIQPDLEQVEQQLDQQETLQEGQQVDQQEIQQLNQQETLQEAQQVDQREKQQELNTMAKSAAPVPRSSQDDLLFELETEIAAAIGIILPHSCNISMLIINRICQKRMVAA
jgi:hypothetical protein